MAAAAARTNSGGGGGDSLKLTTAAVVLGAVISQTRLAETHLLSTKPICSRPLRLSLSRVFNLFVPSGPRFLGPHNSPGGDDNVDLHHNDQAVTRSCHQWGKKP